MMLFAKNFKIRGDNFVLKAEVSDKGGDMSKYTVEVSNAKESDIMPRVDTDSKNWFGLKQDDFRPDRAAHFVKLFKTEYSSIPISSYEDLMKLVSRSKALREWYSIKDAEYVLTVQVPLFYKNRIDPTLYNSIMSDIQSINDAQRNKANDLKRASDEYKKAIEIIEKDEEKKYKDLEKLESNPFIFVMNLTQESIPLTAACAIEKYTPNSDKSPTKDAYAREMLIQFKCNLLDTINKEKLNVKGVKKILDKVVLK